MEGGGVRASTPAAGVGEGAGLDPGAQSWDWGRDRPGVLRATFPHCFPGYSA